MIESTFVVKNEGGTILWSREAKGEARREAKAEAIARAYELGGSPMEVIGQCCDELFFDAPVVEERPIGDLILSLPIGQKRIIARRGKIGPDRKVVSVRCRLRVSPFLPQFGWQLMTDWVNYDDGQHSGEDPRFADMLPVCDDEDESDQDDQDDEGDQDDQDDQDDDFRLCRIELDEVKPLDLQEEIRVLDPEDLKTAEAHTITFYDGSGFEVSSYGGTVLFVKSCGRAGVCLNADSAWTDAGSAEEAVRRYLKGEMIE